MDVLSMFSGILLWLSGLAAGVVVGRRQRQRQRKTDTEPKPLTCACAHIRSKHYVDRDGASTGKCNDVAILGGRWGQCPCLKYDGPVTPSEFAEQLARMHAAMPLPPIGRGKEPS